jgi:hypothetical protein
MLVAQHGPHPARSPVPKPWCVTALVTETGGERAVRAGTDQDDPQAFPEVNQHQDDQEVPDGTSGRHLITQRSLPCSAASGLLRASGSLRTDCPIAAKPAPGWTGYDDLRQPRLRFVSYSQWRAIAAMAATSPTNAMSSLVTSTSSPLSSVARQRKRATVRIMAAIRDLGFSLVMPSTMAHHYHAKVK